MIQQSLFGICVNLYIEIICFIVFIILFYLFSSDLIS
jgi:hypothetical protein